MPSSCRNRPAGGARRVRKTPEPPPLFLGGGADDAVVAEAADLRRRSGLEALLQDPCRDLLDRRAHALELLVGVSDGDLLSREHVEVALRRRLEAPGLARAHLVDGQLYVLAELLLGLRSARLVVDQLERPVGVAVHAVDAPAQEVRPDPERERTLEPDRLRVGLPVAAPVVLERGDRAGAELLLVVRVAEAGAPPRGLEQLAQLPERAAALRVEALEHLVEHDAEALVDRGLLRDAEDARELVLERADPVGVDIRRGQHQAAPPARDERVERRLRAVLRGGRPLGGIALRVAQPIVERGLGEDLALLRRGA